MEWLDLLHTPYAFISGFATAWGILVWSVGDLSSVTVKLKFAFSPLLKASFAMP